MTAARCLSQDGESQHARASSCVRSRADGDFMALEGRSRALQAPVSINAMRSALARALALACDDAHVLKRNEVRQTDGCSGPARVGRFRAENSSQADGKRRTRYERDNPGGSLASSEGAILQPKCLLAVHPSAGRVADLTRWGVTGTWQRRLDWCAVFANWWQAVVYGTARRLPCRMAYFACRATHVGLVVKLPGRNAKQT